MSYIIDVAFAILAYLNHSKSQSASSATVALDFIASSLVVSLVSLSSVWLSLGAVFFITYATKEVLICSLVKKSSVRWAYCVSALLHVAVCVDVEFIGSMVTYNHYGSVMLMVCFAKILSSCETVVLGDFGIKGCRL